MFVPITGRPGFPDTSNQLLDTGKPDSYSRGVDREKHMPIEPMNAEQVVSRHDKVTKVSRSIRDMGYYYLCLLESVNSLSKEEIETIEPLIAKIASEYEERQSLNHG